MSRYLREFFSHGSILAILLFVAITSVWLGSRWTDWTTWVGVLAGAAVFFSTEYTTHRFLFHMNPPKNPRLRKLLHRLHYDHHDVPNELHLLLLPLWYSVPNFAILWGLAYLIVGSAVIAWSVVLGGVLGMFYYEWVHYVAHRPIKPLTRFGRWMKKVHLWHHYKSEHYWYGVSNPLMDYLMGTFRDEKAVEMSPTARKLNL
ncbi:sterol desaturase family protein [Tumebacillus flagellatus]|uniref:Fatty acid hydroxylase n=1 Tax=Tumebacillus flagellatus TaxID=1157490 RepID=A0A074MDI6_9BACL|nr:sterol desaturase family protein [Tumebacillus flagellatus]KEO83912.1 fatty acid hydroxylase [Tumebacillus flagellatus]